LGRTLVAVGLVVVSGVALVAALRPYGVWPLLFVALVPMAVAQYRLLPRRLAWLAPGLTAIVYWAGLIGGAMGELSVAMVVIVSLGAGAITALLMAADRPLSEKTQFRTFVLQVPLLWGTLEILRSGLALGTIGWPVYGLAHEPWLIQPISVLGTSALWFLVVAINAAIALAMLSAIDRRPRPDVVRVPARTMKVSLAGVGAALVVWLVVAAISWNDVNSELGRPVRVAAVQPGPGNWAAGTFGTGQMSDTPALRRVLSTMTREAAARGAQLVVWPELILTFDPHVPSPRRQWVLDVARQAGVYVITGYGTPADTANHATLITPKGDVVGRYDKGHPVTFENEKFAGGTRFNSYHTAIGQLGMVICFDYGFLGPVRYTAISGAQIVAAPAWDWGAVAPLQPWDALVFRSVENRVATIKAEHAWDSAIVDANGEIKASTDNSSDLGERALLIADVHLGPRSAPQLWLGNWTSWFVLAGFALLAVCAVRTLGAGHRRRRRSKAS
jgi:apolipoprotein N-acyltransferase